jgi:hypothetical protein
MKLLNIRKGNSLSLGVKTKDGIIDIVEVSSKFNKDLPIKAEDLIISGENGVRELQQVIKTINLDNYNF